MAEVQARNLRAGMTVRVGDKVCKVLSCEQSGSGKMIHKTHVSFRTVPDDRLLEKTFHPDDRLPVVDLERRRLTYSYTDGDHVVFLDNNTFEEHRLPARRIGPLVPFLREELEVEAEFMDGALMDVLMPEFVELRVASCAPGLVGLEVNTPKMATLENGMEILVPQFIEPGDVVRVAVATRKYLERVQK